MILYIIFAILAIPILFFAFWKLWFLRNPDRPIPNEKDAIICPADGKVIDVIRFDSKKIEFNKGNKRVLGKIRTLTDEVAKSGYMISIFMSPLDVHYNRSPIDGKVLKVAHSDGKLLAVNTIKNGLENEKTEVLIENKKIKLKVIQIAGFLARRIETYIQPGDKVKKGEVFGLINLGSQVTIITPKNVEVLVKKGDRVKAGSTMIGKVK